MQRDNMADMMKDVKLTFSDGTHQMASITSLKDVLMGIQINDLSGMVMAVLLAAR